jgi:arylsulfatase A-like enzyme
MPNYLEGRVLFGPNKQQEPEYLYALWDNLDTVTDRVRSAFTRKLKYIRNFTPGISYYEQGHRNVEAVRAAKELFDQGKLPQQFVYYFKPKPPEELYDLENDPFELTNLANDASRSADLERMQTALDAWIKKTGDSDKPEDPKLIQEMVRLRAAAQKEKVANRGKKKTTQQDD